MVIKPCLCPRVALSRYALFRHLSSEWHSHVYIEGVPKVTESKF